MTGQPLGFKRPPVGVIAPSVTLAESLARELHIAKPVKLSPNTIKKGALGGKQLGTVLVEDSVWPLDPVVMGSVLEALAKHLGSVLLVVARIDAGRKPSGVTALNRVGAK